MGYQIKITWVEAGTNNAACAGNDETVEVDAASAALACKEAAEDSIYHSPEQWETGRYGIIAEHVDGPEVYGIEFEMT